MAVWEVADAMENRVIMDEAGPSEEDKIEWTSEDVQTHFDPHSRESHPPTDSPAQAAINATPLTCQPPANDTFQVSPNNPFISRWRPSVFPNKPSHANNNSHPVLANDGFDYMYVPPAIK